MSLLVVLAGVVLLSVPAITTTTRLTSEAKARLSCAAIACGSVVVGFGLAITASPLLILWHDGEPIGGASHLSPGGRWAWMASAVLVGLAATLIGNAVHATLTRRRRLHAASMLGSSVHQAGCGVEVRILPIDDIHALAALSPSPHVVISQPLRNLLDRSAFDAVVAHEAAHLRLRHDRYLFLLSVYVQAWGWLPFVEGIVESLRHDIEKWADNDAVRSGTTNPQELARAIEIVAEASDGTDRALRSAGERAAALRIIAPCAPPRWQQLTMATIAAAALLGSAYTTVHSLVDLGMIVAAIH